MKATWCQINGEAKEIFKKPKTDSGMKNSLKGLVKVTLEDGKFVAHDQVSQAEEASIEDNYLKTVFENGKLVKEYTLTEVRANVDASL